MPDRVWAVEARSTDVFGRVVLDARANHQIVDGPPYNDCPGEAITPAELFLGAVATCSVELVAVLARDAGIALSSVAATAQGVIPEKRIRSDVNLFGSVHMNLELRGCSDSEAEQLVDGFVGRCPIYGTIFAAVPDVSVDWIVTG